MEAQTVEARTVDAMTIEARMTHPVFLVPAALAALQAYARAAEGLGVPTQTLELVHLRASQINGCSVCVVLHAQALRQEDAGDERLATVAAWRDAPYFTDAERAALELAEAVTRVADRGDPVSDALWAEVARHYDEQGVSALLIAITSVNVWNRLNAATRQVAGAWSP
ncbi:MAG TPA: carboxymuconolactone decarboxylase family protein [Nocardioides sp.]|jgi:AhpD family alkylhydroperoxidase|uniref:carboxymuconolactone decarboxylase family protein n=1 Tax=Nocardioides sp. TaxID=35761 RepID=UPI002E373299|nr:carboxymuconolactone decarboxylase family protein [Nocardioides sp.]HEX3930303.1 carboxymuconolactone decarboxylase family protein [Nocardioides sp.]